MGFFGSLHQECFRFCVHIICTCFVGYAWWLLSRFWSQRCSGLIGSWFSRPLNSEPAPPCWRRGPCSWTLASYRIHGSLPVPSSHGLWQYQHCLLFELHRRNLTPFRLNVQPIFQYLCSYFVCPRIFVYFLTSFLVSPGAHEGSGHSVRWAYIFILECARRFGGLCLHSSLCRLAEFPPPILFITLSHSVCAWEVILGLVLYPKSSLA